MNALALARIAFALTFLPACGGAPFTADLGTSSAASDAADAGAKVDGDTTATDDADPPAPDSSDDHMTASEAGDPLPDAGDLPDVARTDTPDASDTPDVDTTPDVGPPPNNCLAITCFNQCLAGQMRCCTTAHQCGCTTGGLTCQ